MSRAIHKLRDLRKRLMQSSGGQVEGDRAAEPGKGDFETEGMSKLGIELPEPPASSTNATVDDTSLGEAIRRSPHAQMRDHREHADASRHAEPSSESLLTPEREDRGRGGSATAKRPAVELEAEPTTTRERLEQTEATPAEAKRRAAETERAVRNVEERAAADAGRRVRAALQEQRVELERERSRAEAELVAWRKQGEDAQAVVGHLTEKLEQVIAKLKQRD